MRQIAAQRRRRGLDRRRQGEARQGRFGFNAATLEYEDLVEAGVIDPTKVVRVALRTRRRSPASC